MKILNLFAGALLCALLLGACAQVRRGAAVAEAAWNPGSMAILYTEKE